MESCYWNEAVAWNVSPCFGINFSFLSLPNTLTDEYIQNKTEQAQFRDKSWIWLSHFIFFFIKRSLGVLNIWTNWLWALQQHKFHLLLFSKDSIERMMKKEKKNASLTRACNWHWDFWVLRKNSLRSFLEIYLHLFQQIQSLNNPINWIFSNAMRFAELSRYLPPTAIHWIFFLNSETKSLIETG